MKKDELVQDHESLSRILGSAVYGSLDLGRCTRLCRTERGDCILASGPVFDAV